MVKRLWNTLLDLAVLGGILVVSTAALPAAQSSVFAATPGVAESQVPGSPEQGEITTSAAEAATTLNASTVQVANATQVSLDATQDNAASDSKDVMEQVTSVSQLSDVQPTDWAFQALQSLVERYGCIAGYPDGTYRGNRAMTRYEFAAGLNACLDRVNELIATATTDLVSKEDLATLQRLQEEFRAELAALRGRVDAVEASVAELEANQFSTTTKLAGEVVIGVAGIVTGDNVDNVDDDDLDDSTILGHRTRLELNTSFTGEDLLFTRLSTGNFPGFSEITGTPEGELAFTQDEGNQVGLEVLYYLFPIANQTELFIAFTGGAADDFADTLNVLDGDGGSGALSAFGTRNPIYYLVDGAGLAIRKQFGDSFELSLGYLAGEADDPSPGSGLFNGPYSALAQLVIKPTERLSIGLTYINSYNGDDTGTGSSRNNFARFDDVFFQDLGIPAVNVPTLSNSYGIELSWQVSDRFVIGGWAGYTNTRTLTTGNGLLDPGGLDIWNYAVTLGFPNLGREGNLLGFVVGMEPKVTDSSVRSNNPDIDTSADDDTSLHIEGFYQFQVTDNISITPGVIWITAPGFNNDNDDLIIGAIRTTFTF